MKKRLNSFLGLAAVLVALVPSLKEASAEHVPPPKNYDPAVAQSSGTDYVGPSTIPLRTTRFRIDPRAGIRSNAARRQLEIWAARRESCLEEAVERYVGCSMNNERNDCSIEAYFDDYASCYGHETASEMTCRERAEAEGRLCRIGGREEGFCNMLQDVEELVCEYSSSPTSTRRIERRFFGRFDDNCVDFL